MESWPRILLGVVSVKQLNFILMKVTVAIICFLDPKKSTDAQNM